MSSGASHIVADGFAIVDALDVPHRIAWTEKSEWRIGNAGARTSRVVGASEGRSVVCRFAFSRDGRRLYRSHEQILEIDLESGASRAVTSFAGDDTYAATWDLELSPDEDEIYFRASEKMPERRARGVIRAVSISSGKIRGIFDREEIPVWRFSIARDARELRIVSGGKRMIYASDLDGQAVRAIDELSFGEKTDGCDPMHLSHGGVVHVPRKQGTRDELEPGGQAPAISPDRAVVAFMRDEHELWIHRFGEEQPLRLCASRAPSEQSAISGWSMEPVWSPDGRLLWFSSTTSVRDGTPPSDDFLVLLRERYGEQSFEFRHSVELAHWRSTHHVGIVDFATHRIWIEEGHWHDGTWAPTYLA